MWIAVAVWGLFAIVMVGLLFWWCARAEDSDEHQD